MSYLRTTKALALAILLAISTAAPSPRSATTSRGLAGNPPLQIRASSHDPILQAPDFSAHTATIGTATIYADTDEQLELAHSALQAMENANLSLPTVEIHLYSDRAECSGDGTLSGYHTISNGRHEVHSCGGSFTLLHELGHVWDDHQLDDETRQRILDHQQLDTWHDEQWGRSGSEHLASIIAWGLEGTHPTLIGYYTREHLAEAYVIATGGNPPILGGGPAHTRTATTAAQDGLIDEALDLFESADLELPGIDFVGYTSDDECSGRNGAAIRREDRTEIRLCLAGNGPVDDWVVIHEIAHAWDHHTLSDETRSKLLDLRGLDSWRDAEWNERGAEHTAEIMVWGLIDRDVRLVRIGQNSCEELLTAYRTLTGDDPPNGRDCRLDAASA